MNASRTIRRLAALVLAAALGTGIAAAQQEIGISIHGGPASGQNSSNSIPPTASTIRVVIDGDATEIHPRAGERDDQISSHLEAELNRKGYVTRRIALNYFYVEKKPGNVPIQSGANMGCDDTMTRFDKHVHKLQAVVPSTPDTKDTGVLVPVPPDNQTPLQQGGTLRNLIDVPQGNQTVTVTVTVNVAAGMTGAQVRQATEQALLAAGFHCNRVRWTSALDPLVLQDGFLVDRTLDGRPVQHIEYDYDSLNRHIVKMEGGAGIFPDQGATEFGAGTPGNSPIDPYARMDGAPAIGGTFTLVYRTGMALRPGGEVLNLARPALPVPVFNGFLLVEPVGSVFTFMLSDASGEMRHSMAVPAVPGLAGLPLFFQGGVHDGGTLTLTSGVAARVAAF